MDAITSFFYNDKRTILVIAKQNGISMCDVYEKTKNTLERIRALKGSTSPSPINIIDDIMPDVEVTSYTSPEIAGNYGIEIWEALAYDLALALVDEETIAREYDVPMEYLESLKDNVYFMKMYNSKVEEVKLLGSDAVFKVKMRMIASKATPQLLKRLTSLSTSTKDFHNLYKTVIELAGLVQKEESDINSMAIMGPSVVFNIKGVPGLEHLSSKVDIIENTVIDGGIVDG